MNCNVRIMFLPDGRKVLSGKRYSGTVRLDRTVWSVVVETSADPVFGTWGPAVLRPMVESFPTLKFLQESCTMLYEGPKPVAYVSPER